MKTNTGLWIDKKYLRVEHGAKGFLIALILSYVFGAVWGFGEFQGWQEDLVKIPLILMSGAVGFAFGTLFSAEEELEE